MARLSWSVVIVNSVAKLIKRTICLPNRMVATRLQVVPHLVKKESAKRLVVKLAKRPQG
jgi:hypothetical protein